MVVLRLRLGCLRFSFALVKAVRTGGVNSRLKDGKHILMFDFDDCDLWTVTQELKIIQSVYQLPDAFICSTGRRNSYVAFIWKKVTTREFVEIVSQCKHVDVNFLRIGFMRGYWTIRLLDKEDRKIKLIAVIPGFVESDVTPDDVEDFVYYDTYPDGYKPVIVELLLNPRRPVLIMRARSIFKALTGDKK